jgi:hypothetical protein
MIHRFILISLLFVFKSSFSQTIEYNGNNRYKLEQAMYAIKTADPQYYQILSQVSDKISTSKYRFSYPVLDSLGYDWIMVQGSFLEEEDYKMIAASIIHESLHLYYRKTHQDVNFTNVYEEEVQAYSYARNFLIEINGEKSDIQWYTQKIAEYKKKSGT